MPKITVNEKEYDTDNLSDELNAEINMLANVEKKLIDSQIEMAILQTAKNAYSKRIQDLLPIEIQE